MAGECKPGDAGGMRLDLADPGGIDASQAGHAVGRRPALELVEAPELVLGGGDDQLPGPTGVDPVLVAVVVELAGAGDAQPRLQRPGLVVDARRG